MKKRFFILLICLVLCCQSVASSVTPLAREARADASAIAGPTAAPTDTPAPAPSYTPAPEPTDTPEATDAPEPTATPEPTPDPARPMVALTFDDGPTEYTPQVLDLLERYGARGTFFVMGKNLNEKTRPILQRMADMGCDIGMHDLTHRDLTKLSTSINIQRIEQMRSLISAQIDGGYDTHLLRPPFGKLNQAVRRACKAGNVASIRWSVDPRDWSSKDPKAILKIVKKETKDGAILLFHDRLDTTVTALEAVIPYLQAQGYDLVTITELIESSGQSIRYGEDYQRKPGT